MSLETTLCFLFWWNLLSLETWVLPIVLAWVLGHLVGGWGGGGAGFYSENILLGQGQGQKCVICYCPW